MPRVWHTETMPPSSSPASLPSPLSEWLSTPWKEEKRSPGVRHPTMTVPNGKSVLAHRFCVARGTLAGQWSGLAALAYERVCKADALEGARTWKMAEVLAPHADPLLPVRCSQSPYRGCLASALGFEWHPGVAIDAIVLLGWLGQEGRWLEPRSEVYGKQDGLANDLLDFQRATGVRDWKQWAHKHLDGAVAATERLARSDAAALALIPVWATVLKRLAIHGVDVESALPEERRLGLMETLTRHFKAFNPPFLAYQAIAELLFPGCPTAADPLGLKRDGFDFNSTFFHASLCKRLFLLPSSEAGHSLVKQLGEIHEQLPSSVWDMVDRWAQHTPGLDEEEAALIRAQVKRFDVSQRLTALETPVAARSPKVRM